MPPELAGIADEIFVTLPWGFDEHPQARYPLVINHGHFPYTFSGFRETPPAPNLKPEYSERFKIDGYNKIVEAVKQGARLKGLICEKPLEITLRRIDQMRLAGFDCHVLAPTKIPKS